jgi:hypothetical protein
MGFWFPVAVTQPTVTLEETATSLSMDASASESMQSSAYSTDFWSGDDAKFTAIWWLRNAGGVAINATCMSFYSQGTGTANQVGTIVPFHQSSNNRIQINITEGDGAGVFKRIRYYNYAAVTTWQCFAMTYDSSSDSRHTPGNGGALEFFVNGVRVDPDSVAIDTDKTPDVPAYVASEYRCGSGVWVGKYFSCAGWAKVLTDAEITAVYNGGVPIDPAYNAGDYESSADLRAYFVPGRTPSALGTNLVSDYPVLSMDTVTNLDSSDLVSDTPQNPA